MLRDCSDHLKISEKLIWKCLTLAPGLALSSGHCTTTLCCSATCYWPPQLALDLQYDIIPWKPNAQKGFYMCSYLSYHQLWVLEPACSQSNLWLSITIFFFFFASGDWEMNSEHGMARYHSCGHCFHPTHLLWHWQPLLLTMWRIALFILCRWPLCRWSPSQQIDQTFATPYKQWTAMCM